MTPANYDMPDHYKGDTFDSITFTITEDAIPVDLTGASIKIDFRYGKDTGPLELSMAIGSGLTVTDAAAGVFKIDSYINDWKAGFYVFDAEITFSAEVIRTYFKGKITVIQDVRDA